MAEFLVKVADERGHVQEQVENGFSASEVRDRYVQQGFLVYSVKPTGLITGGKINLPGSRKIKSDQFIVFNAPVLSDVIKAGVVFLLECVGVERHVLARVLGLRAPPTAQIFAVE